MVDRGVVLKKMVDRLISKNGETALYTDGKDVISLEEMRRRIDEKTIFYNDVYGHYMHYSELENSIFEVVGSSCEYKFPPAWRKVYNNDINLCRFYIMKRGEGKECGEVIISPQATDLDIRKALEEAGISLPEKIYIDRNGYSYQGWISILDYDPYFPFDPHHPVEHPHKYEEPIYNLVQE